MAYCLPFRGLEGAGDGGRSCPSRSTDLLTLLSVLILLSKPAAWGGGEEEELESDISEEEVL